VPSRTARPHESRNDGGARRLALAGAAATALAVSLPLAWLWGFTVDDALISARVATNIAHGLGHRFNRGGPVVDAVTPLGWAYVLSPFAGGGPLAALHFAKWFGALSWVLAAAWLGGRTAREHGVRGFVVLLPLALCAPLGAWGAAGMETGAVMALATLALGQSRGALAAAGLAAALRPELVPWSVALAVGRALTEERRGPPLARALGYAAGPAALVACARLAAFGHAVPLAFFAKPSDFEHGAFYVAAALLWTGAPILVVAPWAIRRLDGHGRAVLVAALVHCFALVLFRLFTPILPGLFLVGARLVEVAPRWASGVRVGLASTVCAAQLFTTGAAARGVLAARLALIERAAPALRGAHEVAALDVGWVGAATDADVVDLAGITDETIGRLRGGHTSKRVPEGLLRHRGVDALVLLSFGPVPAGGLESAPWARAVEARVAREAADLRFEPRATLELGKTRQQYVVLTLHDAP
jgi:hypothetical protein